MVGDKLADSLRRTFREVAEEGADSWAPILSGLVFFVGVVVSGLDIEILQHGKYSFTVVGMTGVAFLLAGSGLYEVARRTLGELFSEAVRIMPEHMLITSGPYHLIRHPIYLGGILFGLSIPMISDSLYGFVLMLIPVFLLRIEPSG